MAVATAFFTIRLPIADEILSRETARLVLVFRREAAGWRIAHSSISIPYHLVREGEIYPLKELVERNRLLEQQRFEVKDSLERTNQELARMVEENRRAASLLRQSEALYKSILNASPDDITIADLQGRILMVSPAAVAMFGFERVEQGIGRSLFEFIVPEDRQRAAANVALLFEGARRGPSEYRGLRVDGSVFDIEVNTDVIRDPEGRPPSKLVVVVRDISARKAAEKELQAAFDHIRTLRGLLPICMHCKKIRDDKDQWRPVEVYVRDRTEAQFSHSLCPECSEKHYPGLSSDDEGSATGR